MAGHGFTCTILVAVTLLRQISVGTTSLTFKNNQYEELLVAIHPNVKQHPRIIQELIAMITSGSTYLFRATKNRACFGKVNILTPNTWKKNPSWSPATSETFKDADIRVDRPHVSHGSDPYTFQPGLCGEPGKYIHFTPGYLLDENGDREANYGDTGLTLVHEFAHLRYGVFDEYGLGTEEHPYMYLHDNVLHPTACGNTIHRGIYSSNCTISDTTNKPDRSCYLIPDRDNTVSASIMYDPSVDKVTHFCESDSDNPDLKHNSLAPNQHNKMCNGKGTWDVIKEHPDFKRSNPPVNMTASQLRPSFSILYGKKTTTPTGTEVCGRPVVLVLDLSESLNYTNVYHKQTQTADTLIRDILPVGTQVGVVAFSPHAKVLIQLTSLFGRSDRDRVAKSLHSVTAHHGKSGIGRGLMLAKRMLESAGQAKDGRIVLITNGEENIQPYITAVKREMRISGVTINSVAFGTTSTDEHVSVVRELVEETGGNYICVPENTTFTILDSVIQAVNKDISICNHRDRIEIMRKATSLFPNREVDEDITIDSKVGHDTMFVFAVPRGVHVDVVLTSPDGQVYTSSSGEYSFDSTLNIIRFMFERAQTGTWYYTLSATTSGTVTLVVKALPIDNADPYEVDSWLSSMFSDASYGSKPTVVYVHVHKGYSPVTDADVTVTVERQSSASPVTLTPLDNGILPDNMANDGVYSTYFTQFDGNKRYSMDVVAQTIPGRTMVHLKGPMLYGGAQSRFHNTTLPVTVVPAENFTRTTSPGAIDVTGFVPNKDNFAPSRVTDLAVTVNNSTNGTGTVTLTWTAPGDDLATGTANRYVIKMSQTSGAFKAGFKSLVKVDLGMIVSGSALIPKDAGTKERMVIKTPVNWTTIVFGLKTYDEVNHESDLSNIVTATFKKVKLKGQTTTTSTTTTTTTTTASTTPTTTTTTATTTSTVTTPTTTTGTVTIIPATPPLPTTTTTSTVTTPTTTTSTVTTPTTTTIPTTTTSTVTTPTATTTTTTSTTPTTTTTPTTSASVTTTSLPTTTSIASTTPTTSTSSPSTAAVTTTSFVIISPTTRNMWLENPNKQHTVMVIVVSVGVLVVVCTLCLIIVALIYSRLHNGVSHW